jgi:hypothetical protein
MMNERFSVVVGAEKVLKEQEQSDNDDDDGFNC